MIISKLFRTNSQGFSGILFFHIDLPLPPKPLMIYPNACVRTIYEFLGQLLAPHFSIPSALNSNEGGVLTFYI